uniref:Uracil phosphoribosyltransferase n=1 Tax=Sebdenia flabellata TaxID=42024 RepID=A0A1C9CA17_9FLOR|nr:uracil phosphoribosyltransferase [Sebdenia flabellata]AOM65230.1 uracil phosphoribosyltransferase [Sebdenia flabellata]
MQLNIYLISHPIIQKLASEITYQDKTLKQNTHSENYKQLGTLLIYEVMRAWIKTQNLYIKKINYIKELCVFDKKESYFVITDLTESYKMLTNTSLLFPEVEIEHISLSKEIYKINNMRIYKLIEKKIKNNTKILILQSHLNNYRIIKILDYLIAQNNFYIKQIKILCITCNNKIIEKIGYKYPNLKIYTTKIIDNSFN